MSFGTPQGVNLMLGWKRGNRFAQGLGAQLPIAYKKFWEEWKVQKPSPVHYVVANPDEKYKVDPKTGRVILNQTVSLPLKGVSEENKGFWGGEAIVRGYTKRNPYKRRTPHFWIPLIKQSVVRSEILNQNFEMDVTERTIMNVLKNNGFDHYVLKSPACDLRSTLVLKLKAQMIRNILDGFPAWKDSPKKQKELEQEFKNYADGWTDEDCEWYGLNWIEALRKLERMQEQQARDSIVPFKHIYRSKLIEQLKQKASEISAEN